MAHDTTHKLPDNWEPGTEADLNTPMILFVSVIGIVLLIVIVMFLRALYYETVRVEAEEKLALGFNIRLSDLELTQTNQLSRPGQGTIPINRAMQLVIQEYAGQGETRQLPSHAIPGDTVFTIPKVQHQTHMSAPPELIQLEQPVDEQQEALVPDVGTDSNEADTVSAGDADNASVETDTQPAEQADDEPVVSPEGESHS